MNRTTAVVVVLVALILGVAGVDVALIVTDHADQAMDLLEGVVFLLVMLGMLVWISS